MPNLAQVQSGKHILNPTISVQGYLVKISFEYFFSFPQSEGFSITIFALEVKNII